MPSIDNVHGAAAGTLSADEARDQARQLSEQRAAIDTELHSLAEVLSTNNATMSSSLVDHEGFPLANVDIVAIRTARARIIALRNDREAVEKRMRDLVNVALARPAPQTNGTGTQTPLTHSLARETNDVGTATHGSNVGTAMAHVPGSQGHLSVSVPVQNGSTAEWNSVGGLQPFAKVNTVSEGSPAHQAGLQAGDEILQFGDIVASTAHLSASQADLGNLPSAVREGAEVTVVVLRRGTDNTPPSTTSVRRLRLTPSSGWGGRGLLGCHLLAIH